MRMKYLDGLRGVAILLVVGFHAYARWPELVPYGEAYSGFLPFKLGWLGVQLFFLISGFVIFMTLDKTASLRSFLYKRWLRLFPAMLVASILIYGTVPLLSERPGGVPDAYSLIPGLTFMEPAWWEGLLGRAITPLEGAFWSLYVEFKFYVIAGAIYFLCGRRFLIPGLVALYLASLACHALFIVTKLDAFGMARELTSALSLQYFGWFAAGAMFYLHTLTKELKWMALALLMCGAAAVTVKSQVSVQTTLAALLIAVFFAASITRAGLQRLLENRQIQFFGLVSYPLYLLHENAMIAMVVKSAGFMPWLPSFLYPFAAIAVLSGVAYVLATQIEPRLRDLIAFRREGVRAST